MSEHVHVYLHIRSSADCDKKKRERFIQAVNDKQIHLNQHHGKNFTYDRVFDGDTQHDRVFSAAVNPLLSRVIEGYSCFVFMYGPPNTGKTEALMCDASSGYIPRALKEVLNKAERLRKEKESTVNVSYFVISQEELYDVLRDNDLEVANDCLWINNDPEQKGSVYISNLQTMTVFGEQDIDKVLKNIEQSIVLKQLEENEQLKNSHKIFTITVHLRTMEVGQEVISTGKLCFVQLADCDASGSVRNYSMDTFFRMVQALQDRDTYIPYRDSKLTRIVQEAFGGRGKTSFIVNISSAFAERHNSIAAIELSKNLSSITNTPEINKITSRQNIINKMREDIKKLQKELEASRLRKGFHVDADNYNEMLQESEEVTRARAEMKSKIWEIQDNIAKLSDLKNLLEEKDRMLKKSLEITRNRALESKRKLIVGDKQLKKVKEILELQEKRVNEIEKQTKELTELVSYSTNHLNIIRDKASDLYRKYLQNRQHSQEFYQFVLEASTKCIKLNSTAKVDQTEIVIEAKPLCSEILQIVKDYTGDIQSRMDKIKHIYHGIVRTINEANMNVVLPDFSIEKLDEVIDKHSKLVKQVIANLKQISEYDLLNHAKTYEGKLQTFDDLKSVAVDTSLNIEKHKQILEWEKIFVEDLLRKFEETDRKAGKSGRMEMVQNKLAELNRIEDVRSDCRKKKKQLLLGLREFVQEQTDKTVAEIADIHQTKENINNCICNTQKVMKTKGVEVFKDNSKCIDTCIQTAIQNLTTKSEKLVDVTNTSCEQSLNNANVFKNMEDNTKQLQVPCYKSIYTEPCSSIAHTLEGVQSKNESFHAELDQILSNIHNLTEKFKNTDVGVKECNFGTVNQDISIPDEGVAAEDLKQKLSKLRRMNKENIPE